MRQAGSGKRGGSNPTARPLLCAPASSTLGAQPCHRSQRISIGFLILIVGLALAAYLLNVPAMWIGVGVIVLIGIGVLSATRRTKMRDPAEGAPTTSGRQPPTSPNA